MDRFGEGMKDPQTAKSVATCSQCDGEIHEGEEVILVLDDDALLHVEGDCLKGYLKTTGDIDILPVEDVL